MTTININLLPEELRGSKRSAGPSMPSMPTMDSAALLPIAVGVVAAVVIAALPTLASTLYLEPWSARVAQETTDAEAEIAKYKDVEAQLRTGAASLQNVRQQQATLLSVAGKTTSWGSMLDEMRSITPANLWFNSLKVDKGKDTMTLTGEALDYGSVAYFQRNLEHAKYFIDPILVKTSMATNSNGVSVVAFDIKVAVRPIPQP